jgi:hypothetical protein
VASRILDNLRPEGKCMGARSKLDELHRQSTGREQQWRQNLRTDGHRLQQSLRKNALVAVRPFGFLNGFAVLANLVMVVLLARFEWVHRAEPRFFWPAAILLLAWSAILGAGLWQWVAFYQLDFNDPVAVVQDKLTSLVVMRLAVLKWLALLAPLIWVPLCIVALKAMANIDLLGHFSLNRFIATNVLVGVGWTAVLLVLGRRYRSRFPRSSVISELVIPGARQAAVYAEQADWIQQVGLPLDTDVAVDQPLLKGTTAQIVSLLQRESNASRLGLLSLVGLVICTGVFMAHYSSQWPWLVVGLWLDVNLLLTLMAVAWHRASVIKTMAEIDSSTLADKLVALRDRQLRWLQWGLIGAPFFLLPALTALLKAWFGVNFSMAPIATLGGIALLWMLTAAAVWRQTKGWRRHWRLDRAIALAQGTRALT